jgi:hypothetical protein
VGTAGEWADGCSFLEQEARPATKVEHVLSGSECAHTLQATHDGLRLFQDGEKASDTIVDGVGGPGVGAVGGSYKLGIGHGEQGREVGGPSRVAFFSSFFFSPRDGFGLWSGCFSTGGRELL